MSTTGGSSPTSPRTHAWRSPPSSTAWRRPVAVGALPLQCAAYIQPAIDTQALTVHAALDHDRDAIYHAVMQDPLIQARLIWTRPGG